MSNQLYTPANFNSGSLSSQHNNTQILNILNIKDNKMLNHVYRSVKSNYFNSCLVCNQPHNAKIHRMICKLCNLDHYTDTIYPQSPLSHLPEYDNYNPAPVKPWAGD